MLGTGDSDTHQEAELGILQDAGGAFFWEADDWAVRLSFVSPSIQALLGYSPDELKEEEGALKRLSHRDDWPLVLEAMYRVAAEGGSHIVEHRMLHRDGSQLWLQTRLSRSAHSNGKILFAGLSVDITALKTRELEVRGAETDARLLIENLRDFGVFALTLDGRVATWNASAQRLKGFLAAEALGSPLERFFPPADAERGLPQRLLEQAKLEGHAEHEGWLVRKGGSQFWGNVIISPIIDEEGELRGFSNVARDLTERKRAEEIVRQSEEQFRLLIESQEYAVFLTSPEGLVENWNRAAQRLEGYRPHEIIGASFMQIFPEEDVAQGIPQALMTDAARLGTTNYEGWLVRKGGSRFWGLLTVSAVEEEEGYLRGFSMLARDVSERKRTEQALSESEEYFRLLVESIQDYGMFMVSTEGTVQSWNQGAQRLKGYREHEVVGTSFARFWPPDKEGEAMRLIEEALVKGTASYEGWMMRKGGVPFWALVTLSTVEDENGQLRGLSNVARDLTERKKTEDALRESEERLRLLVDSVQDYAVFRVEASGEVASWNAGAERLHGFNAKEALGLDVSRLFEASGKGDSGIAEDLMARAREVGRAEYEGRLMRKGGSTFWGSVLFNAMRDSGGNLQAFSVVARDWTERMRADRNRAFLSEVGTLLAGSLDFRTTLERVVRLATQAMAHWCAVEILDESCLRPMAVAHVDREQEKGLQDALQSIPSAPRLVRGVAHVVASGQPELEAEIVQPSSIEEALGLAPGASARGFITGSYLCLPLSSRGRNFGALVLMAPPGQRYSQEDMAGAQELARRAALAIENARLYEQAQRAVRMRDEVLAVVSHDLRTPLSAIRMGADHLLGKAGRGDDLPAQVVKTAGRIHHASDRMIHLIRDLLDFSNIEAGRLSIEKSESDAAELVESVADMMRDLAGEKGIRLEVPAGSTRAGLLCDRERILQVLSNIVGNAIKFSPEGSTVRMLIQQEEGQVILSVEDDGPGIPEDQLATVFERHVHGDRRAGGGLGLGLAISKAIVEAHGGTLWAKSRLGEGTTICFSLPRR